MGKPMKKKRILGIRLVLLMLFMTACGSSQGITAGTAQESEASAQIYESEVQEVESELQANDSEISGEEVEEDKTETQNEPDAQGEAETTENISTTQGEVNALEAETEIQEQTSDAEGFQEETTNDNLPTYGNNYYDVVNVVLYLEAYNELPPNYITKSEAQALGWEGGSVEKYKEGAAIGGDTFGNREGLLPAADGRKYTECDIDTHGYSSRGSRRLVFSNDGLYFYTSNHYESFSEVTVTENYEVIW